MNEMDTNKSIANMHGWSKHTPIDASHLLGGVQYIFRFENGYGASLINHSGSYGNEIAVLKFYGPSVDDWDFEFDNPIADNKVIGHLTPQGIEDTLDAINALPGKELEA